MSSETPRRRSRRDERSAAPKPMRLTDRDMQVIQAVYEYRVLTTQQIQTLFFESTRQCYNRLAALYQHGFLDRRFLGAYTEINNTPIMYVLDRRGAELLQAQLGLDIEWSADYKQVGIQFLEHTLAINSVRVAIAKACEQTAGFSLVQWLTEADMKSDYDRVSIRTDEGRHQEVSVIPDSYFVLDTPKGMAHFFLELDRGTMALKRYKQKIAAYQAYYASGAYERRYGAKSLRVLSVATSQVRMKNLLRVTEEAGGKFRYWFTSLEQVTPKTVLFTPLWYVATKSELHPLIGLETNA